MCVIGGVNREKRSRGPDIEAVLGRGRDKIDPSRNTTPQRRCNDAE